MRLPITWRSPASRDFNARIASSTPSAGMRFVFVHVRSSLVSVLDTTCFSIIDGILVAIDSFYGHVVQQLRPWTVRPLQLPSGGRTAVEEAGIHIEPPISDLLEDAGSDLTESDLTEAVSPVDAGTPEAVEREASASTTCTDRTSRPALTRTGKSLK